MADITTILPADQVSASRAVINTNFSNLNADKLEASYLKRIYKSADESVSNSIVLQNDNELKIPLGANEVWSIHAVIYFSGNTPDIRAYWNKPTGTTFKMYEALSEFDYIDESSAEIRGYTGASGAFLIFDGWVQSSSTAGDFQFQWAQYIQDLSNATVHKNSYIIAHKLA